MTTDLDLFQVAEPKTCGNCGAATPKLQGPGEYCALSFKDVAETDEACGPWWYPRAKETI